MGGGAAWGVGSIWWGSMGWGSMGSVAAYGVLGCRGVGSMGVGQHRGGWGGCGGEEMSLSVMTRSYLAGNYVTIKLNYTVT